MGRAAGSAKKQEESFSFDEVELIEECVDRTLVLRRDPLPRKMALIAAGAKEIRCISCNRVRPLKGALEYGEGWLCEDCQASIR
jgi:LSD1 subclass zinc finger protein